MLKTLLLFSRGDAAGLGLGAKVQLESNLKVLMVAAPKSVDVGA
jgi:hypothetical protein